MEVPTSQQVTNTWFNKYAELLFAFIALSAVLAIALPSFLSKLMPSVNQFVSNYLMPTIVGFGALASIFLTIYWRRKEKHGTIDSERLHSWLRAILRFYLAYTISVYGFAKILRTQFATVYYRESLPVGELGGFSLTWTYFGYSYKFAVVLAIMQIGGAILLLFRRTTLLGVCVLMPVMVNIILINLFYSISTGAFVISVMLTLGLLYLLSLHLKKLIALFLDKEPTRPLFNLPLSLLLKVFALAMAFYTIYKMVAEMHPVSFIGKWKIKELKRNGKADAANQWLTDKRAWKYAYIEDDNTLSFSPNPYIYEDARSEWGNFRYDAKKNLLRLKYMTDSTSAKDTADIQIIKTTDSAMIWNTVFKNDTLKMMLTKMKRKKK